MTLAWWQARYRRRIAERGVPVILRRYLGTGQNRKTQDIKVLAVLEGYDNQELAGTIQQGDRKAIILAEDLRGRGLLLPVVPSDRLVVDGRELMIMASDDKKASYQGTTIAVILQVRG